MLLLFSKAYIILYIVILQYLLNFYNRWIYYYSFENILHIYKNLFILMNFLKFIHLFIFKFYFTILYWFCHTLTWIHHGCTWVPTPEPPSRLFPHIISLGHTSAPAPSTLHPVSCIEPRLAIHFLHDSMYVSMPFCQIITPSPSHTEFKSLFYTSVSLLLSRIQGYHYHDSKFHIYVLVYCIGVFLSGLLHSL